MLAKISYAEYSTIRKMSQKELSCFLNQVYKNAYEDGIRLVHLNRMQNYIKFKLPSVPQKVLGKCCTRTSWTTLKSCVLGVRKRTFDESFSMC